MKRNRGIGWALVLAASCALAMPGWAESPDGEADATRGRGRMKPGSARPMHAVMRAQMHAHDARLDEFVAAMNAAEGEAKIDAVAAVVNELVAQRRTRRAHMEERWKMERPETRQEKSGADEP